MKSIRIMSPDGEASYHCVRENETCSIRDIQSEWGYLSPNGVFYRCASEDAARKRVREDPRVIKKGKNQRMVVRRVCVYIKPCEPERTITIGSLKLSISPKEAESLKQQLCGSA